MKQETKEKKKPKSITQKAKKVRSIVMMTLLCILMLSASTYAWFTLSNTAKVSNLTMTVGDVTGLQVAIDKAAVKQGTGAGTYGNELSFGAAGTEAELYKITGKLLPATLTASGTSIQKPVYDPNGSGDVTGVDDVTDTEILKNGSADTVTGYYYETTFYLKAMGKDIDVKLANGVGLAGTGIQKTDASENGTYVLNKATQTATGKDGYIGARAVRIWLSAGSDEIIYQPNSDLSNSGGQTYTTATDRRTDKNVKVVTDSQSAAGSFGSSQGKLSLKANADTLVTLRIWIEGTDPSCGNEISLEDIIAQLQFEEKK